MSHLDTTFPFMKTQTQLLSIPETAQRLGVHRSTVYQLISAGQLQAINLGQGKQRTSIRVRESELERFIQSKELSRTA